MPRIRRAKKIRERIDFFLCSFFLLSDGWMYSLEEEMEFGLI
jgi:hypothetical protein